MSTRLADTVHCYTYRRKERKRQEREKKREEKREKEKEEQRHGPLPGCLSPSSHPKLYKLKNLKCPNFRFLVFLEKNPLKIQILDSQLQQKIVAFQSN